MKTKSKPEKIKMPLRISAKKFAEYAFLTFLALFLVSLAIGGLVFYEYSFKIRGVKPEISENPIKFNQKTYEEVLSTWQKKEKEIQEIDSKQYPDPFKKPFIAISTSTPEGLTP